MSALQGIRVLDLGTFIAGPYCATILGEFGAEVIKVEPPKTGDSLRRLGTNTECGDSLLWLSESRNKKCITLNLQSERGQQLLRQLAAKCDVIVENFRPGTLEKWGLSYDELKAINPGAVLVRISAYGQDGPLSKRPGGQCIDVALYEWVFRVLDEIAPAYQKFGYVRERMGADTVNVCPHSHYRTADRKWIAIACSNDQMFKRLAEAMGQPELAASTRYGDKDRRLGARDDVNRIVAAWVSSLDHDTVLARCAEFDVPASLIYSIADIFEDPQYRARGNIRMMDTRIGELAVPEVVPRLSETPGEIRWLGEGLGGHNAEVFRTILGLNDKEIGGLKEQGVI